METIFMKTENSKTSDPHEFVLSLPQRLGLKNSEKHVTLQNLSIYYTWKNIRQQYKNNKLKKKQLQHGTMSLNSLLVLIQCQTFKIISSISQLTMNII